MGNTESPQQRSLSSVRAPPPRINDIPAEERVPLLCVPLPNWNIFPLAPARATIRAVGTYPDGIGVLSSPHDLAISR